MRHFSAHTLAICLGLVLFLLSLFASAVPALAAQPLSAGASTAPVWQFLISTAPGLPQDVWVTARWNNQDGWISAGVFCIRHPSNEMTRLLP